MERIARAFLSLCLAGLMFPSTALAAGEPNATLAIPSLSPETTHVEVQGATAVPTGDVKHVVSKTLGTKTRTVPPATDFHDAFGVTHGYPAYNGTFHDDVKEAADSATAEAQESAVLEENTAILDYTSMDAEGNLYKNGELKTSSADGKTVTKLVRHTASASNYGEAIPDDAPSVTKRLSLRMLRYGNLVTGLYAPPGEVVKVTLKSTSADKAPEDLGLKALIGNYSGTNSHLAITDTGKFDLTRMPDTGISLDLSSEVSYIGSPLGGAILIYSNGIGGTTVEMEIEGAIEMPTFFYGEMDESELAEQLEKPAPYFAFSTPRGVRAVGPASLVRNLPTSQITGALEFWDKAIGVSYQFEAGSFDCTDPDTDLMVETFDPYIPIVGALAANMGSYCVCPISSGASFFDPDTLVSQGSWATIHELNHSFPWGGAVDGTQEISNNVINALTYQLYTNIAASRTEPTNRADPGSGGLSGWNWCTDLFTTVERLRLNVEHTKSGANGDYPYTRWNLQVYVPLQHAFGADRFLDAVHRYHAKGGKYATKLSGNALYTNSNVWMRAASEASGYDLGYYMRDVQEFPELETGDASQTDYITTDVREGLSDTGPLFIPSGCLYASGVVYEPASSGATGLPAVVSGKGAIASDEFAAGKDVVEMGRPFRIPFGKSKMLYFNPSSQGGFVSVANDELVEMVGYTAPQHGTIEATGNDLQLKYTPDADCLDDSFYVTLKLTVTDGDSPYKGQSQDVTFKVALLQDTSQVGFSTTFYDWPQTLAASNAEEDPVQATIDAGVLDKIPTSTQVKGIAGFDGAGKETAGRFAVIEGEIRLSQPGLTNLYVRGNVHFNTCAALTADGLPPASQAQSKIKGGSSAYKSFFSILVRDNSETESTLQGNMAVVHPGESLYVRAFVIMPYDCTCYYRIGYRDETTGGSYAEFDTASLRGTATTLETPAVTDFATEKLYSYPDPSVQTTTLRNFQPTGADITCTDAWNASRGNLSAYSGTKANITDGNLSTHFHSATSGTDFKAEFVFELDDEDTFNAIRYKGHCDFPTRGKFKDYELYVGSDRNALLGAGIDSPLLVSKGTAPQACDEGDFNFIGWDEPVAGKYIRLVATSSYPFNGQYYYAFSDFAAGSYDIIAGEGFVATCNRVGTWGDDSDVFTNTRNPLRITSNGLQWADFNGTGVIVYSTTAPHYGTMRVTLDGQVTDVNLNSVSARAQQPIFWRTGLDVSTTHRIMFAPLVAGTDIVNVDNVEIKGTPGSATAIETAPKKMTATVTADDLAYTGEALEPDVAVTIDGIDVSELCSFAYTNNVNAGTANVRASLADDAEGTDITADASFAIAEATGTDPGDDSGDDPDPTNPRDESGPTDTDFDPTSTDSSQHPDSTDAKPNSTDSDETNSAGAGSTDAASYHLSPIKLKSAETFPTSLRFPKQTVAGADKATEITFDVYVKQVKANAQWVRKLTNITPAGMERKAQTINKLSPRKTYQYQVRAKRVVDGKTVATSTWTSGKVKTGANVAPKIKSAKVSNVRVTKKGKKAYTSYKLKITLAKRIGNGTVGIKASNGTFVKGKGKTFTITFKKVSGNKKGKTAKISLQGYTSKSYGGYTKKSNTVKYKIA